MNEIITKESLLNSIKNATISGKPFFSVELIPGTAPQLQKSLQDSVKVLVSRPPLFRPLFGSVTWHNSHTIIPATSQFKIEHPALELADELQNKHHITTCLHLAAGNLKREQILYILNRALRMGVCSILALRGDPGPNPDSDFRTGAELVRFIREKFGTECTIAVAGYPNTGQSEIAYQQGLLHLKDKVDAGADFVITQVIFRAKDFLTFVDDCQSLGINIPIIPGLFVTEIQPTLGSLERVALLTKTSVPSDVTEKINSMRNDATAQREYIQNLSLRISQELLDSKKTPGIHFFTINRFADYSNLGPNQLQSNLVATRDTKNSRISSSPCN